MAAGDLYIRRNNAETDAITTSFLDTTWDTEEQDQGSTITYSAGNFSLNEGVYLVIYSEKFSTTDTTNNDRIEIQGEIHESGGSVLGGWAQDIIRKSSGHQNCHVSGQTIIKVGVGGADIFTRFYRTDNSSAGTVNRVTGFGGVIILELDTADSIILHSISSTESTSGTTERTLNIDTTDYSSDSNYSLTSGVVTVGATGLYVMHYSIDFDESATGREEILSRITRNGTGTEVVGSNAYSYMRGSDSCQDGAVSWMGLVEASANDTFQVRWVCPSSATITTKSTTSGQFKLWKLPTGSEAAIMQATTGDYNASGSFTWDTLPKIDTASFTATAGTSNIDIDQIDYALIFANFHQDVADSVQRGAPEVRSNIEGTLGTYACSGVYHRNTSSIGRCSVTLSDLRLASSGDSIEINTLPLAAAGSMINDSGQFSVISLESVYGPYSFPPVIGSFSVDNKFIWGETGAIISGSSFGAVEGSGKVEFWSTAVGGTKVEQTVVNWNNTTIEIDTAQGALGNDTIVYLVVTTDGGSVSNSLSTTVGIRPYNTEMVGLNPDHYWRLNNVYTDTGVTGSASDRDDMADDSSSLTFSTTTLSDDNSHSLLFDNVLDRTDAATNAYMNQGTHFERTLACWIQLSTYQPSLGAIYKEGGQVQNLAFIVGMGNVLLAQMADQSAKDNVQCYSDFSLSIDRPYHICMRYSYNENPAEYRLFVDGIEQARTDGGNPLFATNFDSHTGAINWGDPNNNLETGGADIAYSGKNDTLLSDFVTWHDGSTGGGARDKITEIRDVMFRRGAIPKTVISTDTQSAMQTDMDNSADTRVDWPLSYRIEPSSIAGNLEIILTDKTFDDRITQHVEWRGGSTLTIVNINSNCDSAKCYSLGGSIVIETPPTLSITNLENNTEVRIYTAGTTTEIAGQEEVTTGTFSTQIRESTVDIQVMSIVYENLRFEDIDMTAGDVSIPVNQQFDRVFSNP